ncbi:amino acid permease [Kitasatospora nipponensis]|uniref:Amino acid permease n=1 Tax=Kitasatospora nipponensis TaxID=258049 RepID=A0ABN1WXG3_9ACTN
MTLLQGTAMYVGAVLGTGVIALPALAAKVAGPASLLAWAALVLLSAPLAGVFAALGARYPDAGGISYYARLAFGPRAAATAGWCFFFAIPPGSAAAGLFCGSYVASAVGGGRATELATAAGLLAVTGLANRYGVRLSGRLQLGLSGVLVALLLVAMACSLPHASLARLHPFAPHGWSAIGPAASLLVWSFAGWEAITHLAGEFRSPRRDLPRATGLAVLIVGALYLALAFAVIVVLGPAAADSAAPLGDLMAGGLGGSARLMAAGAAVLLTLGTMNAYWAGAAKLGAALGRDGQLPAALGRGSTVGEVPRRSLATLITMAALALGVVALTGVGPAPLVQLTCGSFVTVYALGTSAALRLLPRWSAGWLAALVALVAVAALLVMSGRYLLWPLLVGAGSLLYLRYRSTRDGGRS